MNESRLNTRGAAARLSRGHPGGPVLSPARRLPSATRSSARCSSACAMRSLRRADKGVVLRYLERTTGYSRQQLTRLVGRAARAASWSSAIGLRPTGLPASSAPADVALLAETDALHGTLSGPATVHLLQRAYALYGDARYQRLAGLSVSHLYNLRAQAGYQAKRGHWTKTKGQASPSASAAPRPPRGGRASSASTASTRATSTASRASITSTRWTA